jgi:hypothetical protein
MSRLGGYDGRFALRCWPHATTGGPPIDELSDDPEVLRVRGRALAAERAFGRLELAWWNFELNDWVRMETFEPG